MTHRSPIAVVARLWASNRVLTTVGLVMLAAAVASVVGILVDERTITGAPAWLKPTKFAISTGLYSLTLAWVFTYLRDWPRVRRLVGWTTGIVFVLEVAIIDLQAWRGTTSHFNVGTSLDGTLFAVMGIGIFLQTLMSVLVCVALWRQPFVDRALGWALRLGMAMTIVGAMTGNLMTRPTDAQLAAARTTRQMPIAGAHTVGAPDGGPGLPGTGWSLEYGDVRVAHFLGLHGVQLVPLAAWLLAAARVQGTRRTRLVMLAAGSYASIFGILLWQALRGQSVVRPDETTMAALGVWALLSVIGSVVVARQRVETPGVVRPGRGVPA